jgi:predicted transcriptional regulator of viral defense system
LELLQAYAPEGTICYFTAISFHSLSTQPPVHHHIAIPTEGYITSAVPDVSSQKDIPSKRTPRNPLGTMLFRYGGLPFFRTSREKRLLRGAQLRYIGPTAIIRITDLEQTLLDTLHRPLHCGGPAVAFEAWEQGIKKLREDRLADYLASMQHRPTAQRLGYIFADLDYKPGAKLIAVLNRYLSQLDPTDPGGYQQLFPGMRYTNLRKPWLVYGP